MQNNIISSILLFSMVWGNVDYKYILLFVVYFVVTNYIRHIQYEEKIDKLTETSDRYQKKLHEYMNSGVIIKKLSYIQNNDICISAGFEYKNVLTKRWFTYAKIYKSQQNNTYHIISEHVSKSTGDYSYDSIEEAKNVIESNYREFMGN